MKKRILRNISLIYIKMKIIKFIINDIKKDINTLKSIIKGEAKLEYPIKTLFNKKSLELWFIKNWVNIIIIIAYFLAGYYLGYEKAGAKCNNIINNMINNNTNHWLIPTDILENISFNISIR